MVTTTRTRKLQKEEAFAKACRLLAKGLPLAMIARECNVNRNTVIAWAKRVGHSTEAPLDRLLREARKLDAESRERLIDALRAA
jgi:transposase-like protein